MNTDCNSDRDVLDLIRTDMVTIKSDLSALKHKLLEDNGTPSWQTRLNSLDADMLVIKAAVKEHGERRFQYRLAAYAALALAIAEILVSHWPK